MSNTDRVGASSFVGEGTVTCAAPGCSSEAAGRGFHRGATAEIAQALRRAFACPDKAEAERLRRLAAELRAAQLAAFGSVTGPVRDERQAELTL